MTALSHHAAELAQRRVTGAASREKSSSVGKRGGRGRNWRAAVSPRREELLGSCSLGSTVGGRRGGCSRLRLPAVAGACSGRRSRVDTRQELRSSVQAGWQAGEQTGWSTRLGNFIVRKAISYGDATFGNTSAAGAKRTGGGAERTGGGVAAGSRKWGTCFRRLRTRRLSA